MHEVLKIPPLNWHNDEPDKLSPFCARATRPLKLMIHSSGLNHLEAEDQKALDVIRELGNLLELDVLEFEQGHFPYIQYEYDNDEFVDLHIEHEDGSWRKSWIERREIARLSGSTDESSEVFQLYLALLTHKNCSCDIFVSCCAKDHPYLANEDWYNIRKPTDALKIIGLLLRQRDIWTFWNQGCQWHASKREFYWILMSSKLPALRGYFSECFEKDGYNGALTNLASSIRQRCYTLLQIRDELAKQYYGDNDHEAALYHFNYLFLLLTGIFDAQARVICRAYNLECQPYLAGFGKDKFIAEIRSHTPDLHALITSGQNKSLFKLLAKMRNIIHGADHAARGEAGQENKLHIVISPEVAEDVWEASQGLDFISDADVVRHEHDLTVHTRSKSGMSVQDIKQVDVIVEPFNFSVCLLHHSLNLINAIADRTCIGSIEPNEENSQEDPAWRVMAERFQMMGG
jgi:hypothetical protein